MQLASQVAVHCIALYLTFLKSGSSEEEAKMDAVVMKEEIVDNCKNLAPGEEENLLAEYTAVIDAWCEAKMKRERANVVLSITSFSLEFVIIMMNPC